MYLCVRGYQAMTESGHIFVCCQAMTESGHGVRVPSHDREWSVFVC